MHFACMVKVRDTREMPTASCRDAALTSTLTLAEKARLSALATLKTAKPRHAAAVGDVKRRDGGTLSAPEVVLTD